MTFFAFSGPGRGGPRVAPPDTRSGHEVGYVVTQWEVYPRADSRRDGEKELDEIMLRKR